MQKDNKSTQKHQAPTFDLQKHSKDLMKIEELGPDELDKAFNYRTRAVEKECPFDCGIAVRDISLKAKGPDEDAAFALNPKLWLNIRRGNTILDFYDAKDKYEFSTIGRKGLNKFFDLQLQYVVEETRHDFRPESRGRFDAHNSYSLKNQILAGAKMAMEKEGCKVEVIKTLKANGENAQISWSEDADCWVIASKNVSLLAETEAQVLDKQNYNPDRQSRYFFAI